MAMVITIVVVVVYFFWIIDVSCFVLFCFLFFVVVG